MKRIILSACLLLIYLIAFSALPQAQRRNTLRSTRRKHTVVNRPPKIISFTSSSSTATIPCPYGTSASAPDCNPPGILLLKLRTRAVDPDRNSLTYEYSVSAGSIVGSGSSVIWNLAGISPGSYIATVVVKDQRGGMTPSSTRVDVRVCGMCPVPCASLSMSCPEEADFPQALVLSVSLSGGDPNISPRYNWSLSAGTISKGEGTHTIELDTTNLAGQKVTATVVIGGYPPECPRVLSCEILIRKRD